MYFYCFRVIFIQEKYQCRFSWSCHNKANFIKIFCRLAGVSFILQCHKADKGLKWISILKYKCTNIGTPNDPLMDMPYRLPISHQSNKVSSSLNIKTRLPQYCYGPWFNIQVQSIYGHLWLLLLLVHLNTDI